ncbi:MAG TPA: AMP-binding protein [Candidatus Angelobacter sp.]|nr:AMP-binding protein [Candidatus Angelobacter sp.]
MSGVIHPFDESGIARGADGVARYQNRPRSLVEMLRASVEKWPGNEAVVEVGGERLTYRNFWERAARAAGGLRALGIQPGDRVAIRLGNGADWCIAFFAIQMAGAVGVPVNTRFTESEIDYVVKDSGSRFVFMPGAALPQGESLVVENQEQKDVAAIFYTSGTTGFPKGAMITHEGFLSNIETSRRVSLLPMDGSQRTLVSVPLFHVTGCNSQFLVACEGGSATVIMPAFSVQSFLKLIEAERISTLTSVPAVFWLAINQPNFKEINTKAIIRVSYGGAPIAPDLVGRIIEAFPNARVGNGFGLTECSSVATFLPHEYARLRPETVGFAAPVVDLKLEGVFPGTDVGELLMRGPNVVPGYWNKPEATAETFAGGWLHTGDMARLDEQGFVQIVDRKKDMVNRGGENVYCVEVENALFAHPAVYEVAVVGVPDTMMGEKVGAAIVLKPGARAEANDILKFAKEHLADFKVPQYLVVRSDTLPRNPGGKILKKQLRETLEWGKQLW